ncbi:MAG: hypothetical protein P3X22_002230 [Thermoprotei archaeon]|nr:hypothetical protein [Thermoprotei archaeon]
MIVLIYHDPGLSEGHTMMVRMAEKLRSKLGVDVRAYPISSIEEGSAMVRQGDIVFALLPFRGGHLSTVEEYVNEAKALMAGKIPLEIIAKNVVRRLEGCEKVTVLYWKAKRRVEDQLEDLNFITSRIRELLGNVEVRLALSCNSNCEGCVVVASLLPGRLTVEASSKGLDVRVPYLLALIEDDIISWIEETVTKSFTCKAGIPERI